MHLALDVAGMVPVIGAPADLANAAWYTVEGDYLDASLSLVAAMPVLGDAALASKYGVKGGKALVKGADEFLGGAKALNHGVSATTTALHAINGGQDLVAGGKAVEHAAASSSGATRQAAAAQAQAAQVARAQAAAARAEATATSQAQDIAGKVARSCLNSFPGATRVLLGNGTTTPIDQVQVGDWVEATDPDTGQTVAEPVTAVIITPTDRDFTDTTIRTADGTASTITSTQHHRFYDVTRHAWIDAADLHPGDLLREPDGSWVTVVSVRNYHTHTTTYNLTVQTLHTYYILAGNTPILVHNCGGYFPGHAASCTCEGIGEVTYESVAEAVGVGDDFTRHAIQRLEPRGVSELEARAVLESEPFSYFHEDQWKLGYYDPSSKVFVAKTIDGNINTVMTNVGRAYIKRLKRGADHGGCQGYVR